MDILALVHTNQRTPSNCPFSSGYKMQADITIISIYSYDQLYKYPTRIEFTVFVFHSKIKIALLRLNLFVFRHVQIDTYKLCTFFLSLYISFMRKMFRHVFFFRGRMTQILFACLSNQKIKFHK